MEGFSVNTTKSFLGWNVKIHLTEDPVIATILLTEMQKDKFVGNAFVKCVPYEMRNTFRIPPKGVAWAESLNLNLMLLANKRIG